MRPGSVPAFALIFCYATLHGIAAGWGIDRFAILLFAAISRRMPANASPRTRPSGTKRMTTLSLMDFISLSTR